MSVVFKQFKNPKTGKFIKFVYVSRGYDRKLRLDEVEYCDDLGDSAKLINKELIELLEKHGYESIEILKRKGELRDVKRIWDW